MILPVNIISDFIDITNYPLDNFLTDYSDFITSDRLNIFAYYAGEVSMPNQKSFSTLNQLLNRSEEVLTTMNNHRNSFQNASYWELIDVLTEIQGSLQTVDNSFKWMRSAISKNDFSSTIERDDFLKQNETLELMSARFGSNDRDNDWKQIALRNDLIEEQYTPDGGNILTMTITKRRLNGYVKSVVDTLQGKKMYGIDLLQKITFDQDEQDITALSYDDTVKQSVSILTKLKQGDTPEFPLEGIQSIASNRESLPYTMLTRQFYTTFKTDDTLANLTITNIKNIQDALMIEFTINTVLGSSLIEQTQL